MARKLKFNIYNMTLRYTTLYLDRRTVNATVVEQKNFSFIKFIKFYLYEHITHKNTFPKWGLASF